MHVTCDVHALKISIQTNPVNFDIHLSNLYAIFLNLDIHLSKVYTIFLSLFLLCNYFAHLLLFSSKFIFRLSVNVVGLISSLIIRRHGHRGVLRFQAITLSSQDTSHFRGKTLTFFSH